MVNIYTNNCCINLWINVFQHCQYNGIWIYSVKQHCSANRHFSHIGKLAVSGVCIVLLKKIDWVDLIVFFFCLQLQYLTILDIINNLLLYVEPRKKVHSSLKLKRLRCSFLLELLVTEFARSWLTFLAFGSDSTVHLASSKSISSCISFEDNTVPWASCAVSSSC